MKLFKIIMTAAIALGMTSAWADLTKSDSSSEVCSPKVHFKQPQYWGKTFIVLGDSVIEAPKADRKSVV